jgi:hypothetical protein
VCPEEEAEVEVELELEVELEGLPPLAPHAVMRRTTPAMQVRSHTRREPRLLFVLSFIASVLKLDKFAVPVISSYTE